MPMTDGQDLFEPLAAPEKPKRTRKKKAEEQAASITEETIAESLDPAFADFLTPEAKKVIFAELLNACKATRIVTTPRNYRCKKCGCPHMHSFEITDTPTFLKAVELVLNRAYGRPGQAAGEDAGVIVKLITVGVDE